MQAAIKKAFGLTADLKEGHGGVFDVTGREVRSLARAEWFTAGRYRRTWDARLASGKTAPPGLYFIRLSTTGGLRVHEVVKLR